MLAVSVQALRTSARAGKVDPDRETPRLDSSVLVVLGFSFGGKAACWSTVGCRGGLCFERR